MKLAVLGTDADVLALVSAAVAAGHEIGWLGDVREEDRNQIERLLPGVRASANWESLLDHTLVDAVIVGRGSAADAVRADQLKRLAADIMPVLAVHPVGTSVLVYYELDMARHEVHGILRHYAPLLGSPTIDELASLVERGDGTIGEVHQVICQRNAADCGRESVLRHLARDVEVLRYIAGGIRTISAVGPRTANDTYASLQVQMTGPGPATLRWAIAPGEEKPLPMLSLVGQHGTKQSMILPAADAAQAAIDGLVAAIACNGTSESEAASTWKMATAAMEVVDTIELSLQKGRTIDVHEQRLTEQLAFRGTMAAFGCGLLLFTLFALIAAGLLGDLFGVFGVPIKHIWPAALLMVLALFLLLQALPWWVTRRRPKPLEAERDQSRVAGGRNSIEC